MYVCKCEDFKKYMKRISNIVNSHYVRTGNMNSLGADYKIFQILPLVWGGAI